MANESASGGYNFQADPNFGVAVKQVMTDLLGLPQEFMDYTVQYAAMNPLAIPISQITGFMQFVANTAPVKTGTSTVTSSAYGDCGDGAGPTLSALGNGKYVVLYSASAVSSLSTAAGGTCVISPKFNATEASDLDLAVMTGTDESTLFGFTTASLSNGNNNSVTLRYRTGATASTATFRYRRLMVLKYANL